MKTAYILERYNGPIAFLAYEDDGYPRIYRWDEEESSETNRVYYADQAFWEVQAGIPPKRVEELDFDRWENI